MSFQPLRSRADRATTGLKVALGAHALAIALFAVSIPFGLVGVGGSLYLGAAALQGLSTVGCAALFLPWWHAAYGNLPALQWGSTRTTPGMAVAWFFVPLLNLWMPYQGALEIWGGSVGAFSKVRRPLPAEHAESPVNPWWYAWLGSALLSMQAGRFDAPALEGATAALASAVAVVSAVYGLKLVASVTELQEQGAAALQAREAERPSGSAKDPLTGRGVAAASEVAGGQRIDPLAHLKPK